MLLYVSLHKYNIKHLNTLLIYNFQEHKEILTTFY